MAALGLHCCGGLSLLAATGVAVCGLLIAVASLVAELRALGAQASVVVARGLSCSAACGTFPDQGSNLCPLHWQVDS